MKSLFEVALVQNTPDLKDTAGNVTEGTSTVLVAPKYILAKDVAEATILIQREIPEANLAKLSEVSTYVRPFSGKC